MYIGFKRIKIQPLDSEGAADGAIIIIEGTQGKGASQEATISGLSPESVKAWGSDVPYYVSQKGTGDVKVVLKLLDVPNEAETRMLGYEMNATLGARFVGENTEPPYCAITLESGDAHGETALFGFFKGKFSKGDTTLKTKEGTSFTPEPGTYTFSAVASDRADETNGNAMVEFIGSGEKKTAIEVLVFGTGA